MTQAELLSTTRLRLNDTVRQSTAQPNRVLMRTARGEQRLVLTRAQAAILTDRFAQPTTVPEALVQLLSEHVCPPLSEFYELILQAKTAGVLITEHELAESSPARRWHLRFPVRAAGWLGQTVIVVGSVALALNPWSAPSSWIDWLAGWLVACSLLSLGQLLAACALAGGGCEVRAVRFHWLTPLPHLRLDTAEAAMGGRECEIAVATLRAMPLAAGAAQIAAQQPGWLAPVLAGFFYVLAPWRDSAADQWLQARVGAKRFSVGDASIFEQRREDTWAQWRAWWDGRRPVTMLHWPVWILVAGLAFAHSLPGPAAALFARFGPSQSLQQLLNITFYTLAAAVLVGAAVLTKAAFGHWWLNRKLRRPLREDASREAAVAPLQGDIPSMLRKLALFQSLSDDDLAAVATAMQTVHMGKREVVFSEDDPGDTFYIVLEGEVEILKRQLKSGKRQQTIGWLGPGSGFGEIALLEGTVRSATVRASRPSRLLRLGKTDFDRLVVGRIGAAHVRELLLYATFLGRLVIHAGWPFDDLVRYAQHCGSVRFATGSYVLQRGNANNWFYLIYDGTFEARAKGSVLNRMRSGDYFGEISLLGNTEVTADVVAMEESRCLTMSREDFLAFFAKDFRIGLRMEALATQRLGSRLFVPR